MSVYSLTTASEKAIGMLLTAGGGSETLLLRRPANELRAELHIEPAASMLSAVVYVGHDRHSQSLQAGDSANAQHLADFIEAIANGTASTAETGAIGKPSQPALSTADHNLLLVTCQKGGHASLAMGATITVHAHDLSKRTAITVRGDQSSIHSGSVRDVISALRESLAA
ncbi:hypothetical protein [Ectopseudomonas khazarica]|uniref:hypothetical protein n=1 Tax=Ectopseudomonas khazarica TaxID=2502979 RepID=UPI003A93DB89